MRKYHQKKITLKPLYEYEPWTITEKEFRVDTNHHNETIMALGNGYMGVRGTMEEVYTGPASTTTPGIYINGVYGAEEIIYGEVAPDQPKKSQTMLNLADWTSINLYIDGNRFDMFSGQISDYSRQLDMEKGILTRSLIWSDPEGKKIRIKITRLVFFVQKELGIIKYSITPLNFSGNIRISSAINGDVKNSFYLKDKKELTIHDLEFTDPMGYLLQEAKSTGFLIQTAMHNRLYLPDDSAVKDFQLVEGNRVVHNFDLKAEKGKEYSLLKYVSVVYNHCDKEQNLEWDRIKEQGLEILNKASANGWQYYLNAQYSFLKEYWQETDVKIEGDLSLQQAFRFNAFHLLQSTGRDGWTNVPAKGLTGEHYEGHYFWDTETYIIPFYLYSHSEIVRDLLIYRYNTLDKSRDNARRVKLDGALFSWRTINGEEASSFFMGSTVQYHINADIAYAIYQYFKATDDYEFIFNYGVEILVETARMWASLGSYIPLRTNKFYFNEVCGPDEYKPGVNNNCYTNYMAKFNLEFTIEAIKEMKEKEPFQWTRLMNRLNLKELELKEWQQIAEDIYLPYNEELEIYPQDDSFLYKHPIDVDLIPEEEIPLVQNWHPLIIWRYQVIKQADVILLMLLLGEQFTTEEKKKNYDYYEPKTTHDSSLSPAIHSIIASEIGYYQDAYNYFTQTTRLDLDDYNNNAYQGIHTACMGSSWMALIMGFAGMRNYNGKLYFNPYLPEPWKGYEFKIKFRNCQLKVSVEKKKVLYKLLSGQELKLYHDGHVIELNQEFSEISMKN